MSLQVLVFVWGFSQSQTRKTIRGHSRALAHTNTLTQHLLFFISSHLILQILTMTRYNNAMIWKKLSRNNGGNVLPNFYWNPNGKRTNITLTSPHRFDWNRMMNVKIGKILSNCIVLCLSLIFTILLHFCLIEDRNFKVVL